MEAWRKLRFLDYSKDLSYIDNRVNLFFHRAEAALADPGRFDRSGGNRGFGPAETAIREAEKDLRHRENPAVT